MWFLEIQGLSEEQLVPIQKNKIGDSLYIAVGKDVVKKLIVPPVARFLDILRTNYGQYWIRKLESWDSRKESLGSYCRSQLQLKWSLDGGKTWERFLPDRQVARLTATIGRSFREYLTEEDWGELAKAVGEKYEPSLAAFALSRTNKFLDQGNLKQALVEGVSALEIALDEFIRKKFYGADSLLGLMSPFFELRLPVKVTTVATISGKILSQDIEHTIEAIDMRNRVVHEGWNPPDNASQHLRGLLRMTAILLSGPQFRFPSANPGNALRPPEKWEKEYR